MPIISHFFLSWSAVFCPSIKAVRLSFLNVKISCSFFRKPLLFVGSAEFEANLTNEGGNSAWKYPELLPPPEQVPKVLTDFSIFFLLGTR